MFPQQSIGVMLFVDNILSFPITVWKNKPKKVKTLKVNQ